MMEKNILIKKNKNISIKWRFTAGISLDIHMRSVRYEKVRCFNTEFLFTYCIIQTHLRAFVDRQLPSTHIITERRTFINTMISKSFKRII